MANAADTMGPVDQRIGASIRTRRRLLGLSVDELAVRLRCPPAVVEDYEAGRVRAGANVLLALTQTLGVEIGYFIRGLAEDTPPASLPAAPGPGGSRA